MKYLLDVNVLIAWGWADHADHQRVDRWLGSLLKNGKNQILTSAIPQLGFVRVSVQRTSGRITPAEAGRVLAGMLNQLSPHHTFLADQLSALDWPAWCDTAAKTSDAHLLRLAQSAGATLATLDEGIPNAFLIP